MGRGAGASGFPGLIARPGLVIVGMMALLVSCGSSGADEAAPVTVASREAGTTSPDSSTQDGDGAGGEGCREAGVVAAIVACLDGGGAPRGCLATVRRAGELACDDDQDGLDDALEDAMLHSYAPVFAFNQANGDHSGGDTEGRYPASLDHFTQNAKLYWRVDGNDDTKQLVNDTPTLAGLPTETFSDQGKTHHANDVALGEGPNFWMCLNTVNGSIPDDVLVRSADASRQLKDGISIYAVAHPAGGDRNGHYAFLGYMAFYVYNLFTLDDHEGDFEGGAVFVNLDTGKVAALYTDRHATSDTFQIIPLEGTNALAAKDPLGEDPKYNICNDVDGEPTGGVRFYDFAGAQHHPVIYTAGGSHASYGYPGATKIQGLGCVEASIVRDVHNGQGAKLLVHESAYVTDFAAGAARSPVTAGVHVVNVGERAHLRETWSAYVGQWGCTLASIPKSYPGPWDNDRLCRHWLTNDWGDAPPFAKSTATSCQ